MNYKKAILKDIVNLNGRRLIIWSEGLLAKCILETLSEMKISVYALINENNNLLDSSCNIINNFSEIEGGKEQNFIIVALHSGHKDIVDLLNQNGYEYNKDFIVTNMTLYIDDLNILDTLLAYSRCEKEYNGIVCFGNTNNVNSYKILVLGNSSSENNIGGNICWSKYLYDELKSYFNEEIIIYNGAMSGYTSGQEFLKLARDGMELAPDLVISFSGVNDIIWKKGSKVYGYRFLNTYSDKVWKCILQYNNIIPDSLYMRNMNTVYNGITTGKKDYELWIENERMMHALCEEFGYKFIGILQPLINVGGAVIEKNLVYLMEEAGMDFDFINGQKKFVYNVVNKIDKYPYIYNLTNIFYNKDNMFYDGLHYTEEGNKIIALYIKDIILKLAVED